MEKLFNIYSIVAALAGGVAVKLFGGWDALLQTILVLTILDYITGIIKAIINKELSSYTSFKGILKKMLMYVVIACAVSVENIVGEVIPLRETVIMFFVANEALSLLENSAEFVPIPSKLKEVLLQLRESKEK
jgi:toxin secretion/phage lysis holin